MGFPISPIVANLYMEDFEIKAINSSPQPPIFGKDLWMTPLPSSHHHRKQFFGTSEHHRPTYTIHQ